jgi:DNA-binding CsgD family transcriptional regulator
MAGRLDEAGQALALGDSLNVSDVDVVAASFIRAGEGRLALFRGQPRTAVGLLREAVGGFAAMTGVRGSWTLRLLAEALALLGEVDAAQTALAEAAHSDGAGQEVLDRDGSRAAAWVSVAGGELSRALTMLEDLAAEAAELGEHGYEAMIRHDCVRLGGVQASWRRLVELAELVDGPAAAIYAAHAAALATGDAPGLDGASAEFEQLGFALLAAEASMEAASAHRAQGHTSAAHLAAARGQRLLPRCEGARTPALQAGHEVGGLTSREREIATLAGRGLSSNEIAATMQLSRRTVDNHLQRTYDKLGIGRREQLRDVLGLD